MTAWIACNESRARMPGGATGGRTTNRLPVSARRYGQEASSTWLCGKRRNDEEDRHPTPEPGQPTADSARRRQEPPGGTRRCPQTLRRKKNGWLLVVLDWGSVSSVQSSSEMEETQSRCRWSGQSLLLTGRFADPCHPLRSTSHHCSRNLKNNYIKIVRRLVQAASPCKLLHANSDFG